MAEQSLYQKRRSKKMEKQVRNICEGRVGSLSSEKRRNYRKAHRFLLLSGSSRLARTVLLRSITFCLRFLLPGHRHPVTPFLRLLSHSFSVLSLSSLTFSLSLSSFTRTRREGIKVGPGRGIDLRLSFSCLLSPLSLTLIIRRIVSSIRVDTLKQTYIQTERHVPDNFIPEAKEGKSKLAIEFSLRQHSCLISH